MDLKEEKRKELERLRQEAKVIEDREKQLLLEEEERQKEHERIQADLLQKKK